MQGAQAVNQVDDKEAQVPHEIKDEDRVGYWMQKGFLTIATIGVSMAITFGIWLVTSLNEIRTSTNIVAVEFAATKRDITDLKTSVDSLRLRGESWANKDQVTTTKEQLMSELGQLKDKMNVLELRVQRIETTK